MDGRVLVPVVEWEAVTFLETWWGEGEVGQRDARGRRCGIWRVRGGEVRSDVVVEEDGRGVDYYVEQ